MPRICIFTILFIMLCYSFAYAKKKRESRNHTKPDTKYDKPGFIRERYHDEIWKPYMDDKWVNRFKKPFHPAWMDYCAPYHCNDYHKAACGFDKRSGKFKQFQSGCHIELNNLCSTYLGTPQYKKVDIRYCSQHIMFLRGCPTACPDKLDPICSVSRLDNKIAMFINKCAMERANCRRKSKFVEVDMETCEAALIKY